MCPEVYIYYNFLTLIHVIYYLQFIKCNTTQSLETAYPYFCPQNAPDGYLQELQTRINSKTNLSDENRSKLVVGVPVRLRRRIYHRKQATILYLFTKKLFFTKNHRFEPTVHTNIRQRVSLFIICSYHIYFSSKHFSRLIGQTHA